MKRRQGINLLKSKKVKKEEKRKRHILTEVGKKLVK